MFRRLRDDWAHFAAAPAGSRFELRYERGKRDPRGMLTRIGWLLVGLLAMAAGIVMIFTPGPGLLALGFGATCIAQESLGVARACDRAEVRLRAFWERVRRRRS